MWWEGGWRGFRWYGASWVPESLSLPCSWKYSNYEHVWLNVEFFSAGQWTCCSIIFRKRFFKKILRFFIWSHDKTSQRSEDKNVPRQNDPRHKVPGTKRPKGQNIPRTKQPKDKTSQGQNLPMDKRSQGTKCPILITKLSKTHFVLENWPHMLGKGLIRALNLWLGYSYFG